MARGSVKEQLRPRLKPFIRGEQGLFGNWHESSLSRGLGPTETGRAKGSQRAMVTLCVGVCIYKYIYLYKKILAGPHKIKGLFEGYDLVLEEYC